LAIEVHCRGLLVKFMLRRFFILLPERNGKRIILNTAEVIEKMNNKIFWVGCFPPEVHSIGDHAQTLAVQNYLKENFADYEVKRFYRSETKRFFKEKPCENDLIFIHSSGDFGDIYPEWHRIRKKIIASYPQCRIVQLPVSVHYENPACFEADKIFFSNKSNLLILCRSIRDAEMLKENFSCRVRFFPDFTFYLKPNFKPHERSGWLLILRNDGESKLKRHVPKFLMKRYMRTVINFLLKLEMNKRISNDYPDAYIYDTQVSKQDITDEKREKIVFGAMRLISRFNGVVTDRFHARVFAYLTGTTCCTLEGKIKEKTEIPCKDYKSYFAEFRELVFEEPIKQETVRFSTGVLDVIKQRRSFRKWLSKAVSPETLNTVLEAGYYAPSAANAQAVKLFPIQNKSSVKFLCDNTSVWFKESHPKVAVLVLYDLKRASECDLTLKWHERFAWQDTACASMNMMLAAESLGLRTCFVSFNPSQQKQVVDTFGFKDVVLANAVFLGYSNQKVSLSSLHQGRILKKKMVR
jgi:exopolysaccharide biosynthesis predicted pyruvyltransferase EpsI